jgi:hypothetical protein
MPSNASCGLSSGGYFYRNFNDGNSEPYYISDSGDFLKILQKTSYKFEK